MPSVTPKFSVTFSVPEDEVDVTVNDRRALVCLAMAAFADASTEFVVSARADGRADGVNPQQVKITSAVVASVRRRSKRRALDLWTEPTPTNLTAARRLEPIGHEEQTQPVACCAAQSPPDGTGLPLSPARTGLDQGVTGERPTWLRTLRSSDLVRRVAVVDRLKLCLLVLVVMASGLVLLALAAFVVLTNTVALVITLAIVGTVIFWLSRRGLAEARRTNAGR
jgi:hypothetical protein